MALWVVFAGLSAVAVAVLAMPLWRRSRADAAAAGFDLAVYRDQLAELERDAAAGLIGPAEAAAARNEVSRRLLAAQARLAAPAAAPDRPPRWLGLATLAAVPALAVVVYAMLGRPDLPAVPLASRLAQAVENQDLPAMIVQVEKHLGANPQDARGWAVLAPAYRRLGRYADAARAYDKAMEIAGEDAATLAEYGEALVLANDGIVPSAAHAAFVRAIRIDRGQMKARFFAALADQQEGRRDQALAQWQAMLAEGPADASWRPAVEQQVAALGAAPAGAPALTEEQMAAAANLSEADRRAMVRGMVDDLDARLRSDGRDLDAWLRLARARLVLGERDKAAQALADAERTFLGDATALGRIAEARRALQID